MSIKTLKKRVALIVTIALGVSALSVLPANATPPDDIAQGDIAISTTTASPGICAVVTTAGSSSITLVAGRTFTLTTASGASGEKIYVGVSGSIKVDSSTGYETTTETYASSQTGSTLAAGNYAQQNDTVVIQAVSAGTGTVSLKSTSTTSSVEVFAVTVVDACATNKLSLGDSFVQVKRSQAVATSNIDASDGLTVANSGTSYIALYLVDVYGNQLSGAGVLAASATNGAVINWDSTPSVQSSVAYLSTRGVTGTDLFVTQGTANKDKPISTTVTITLDGAAVATKTIKFTGVPAKILTKDVTVGKVAASGNTGYYRAKVQDSAGNDLASKAVESDTTANSDAAVASIVSAVGTATSGSDGDWSATGGGTFTCVKGGVTTVTLKTAISSIAGTYVKQTMTVACGGVLDTWTLAMDKAVYQPGEIATLTVTGKDALGNLVNSNDTLNGAGVAIEYSFGGLTAITAPTGSDVFTSAAGAKQYKFSVGSTEGSFVGSFKIAGATDTAAKTVQYKVASGTASVSNADVLKSIVALIASINKQIQALQKLILKR